MNRSIGLMLVVAAILAAGVVASAGEPLRIGYIVSDMSHEWYQNICNGAKRRATEKGVEIIIADAAMDVSKQISQSENLMASGINVLIMTPVDQKALAGVIADAHGVDIPVIVESNNVEGADCLVGISNLEAGKKTGHWMAEYAKANNIHPKCLIIGFPNYQDARERVEGFKTGMTEKGLSFEVLQEVSGQGAKEISLQVAADALTAHRDVNTIFGVNDNSTTGGMNAYKEAGLDMSKLTAIGFGFEGVVGREALLGNTPYKAALAMFPDFVGACLVDAAIMAHNGEKLPQHYETPTVVMTKDNFSQFYTKNADGSYTTNFAAIDALMKK